MSEKPNHTTARKPGHFSILSDPVSFARFRGSGFGQIILTVILRLNDSDRLIFVTVAWRTFRTNTVGTEPKKIIVDQWKL